MALQAPWVEFDQNQKAASWEKHQSNGSLSLHMAEPSQSSWNTYMPALSSKAKLLVEYMAVIPVRTEAYPNKNSDLVCMAWYLHPGGYSREAGTPKK